MNLNNFIDHTFLKATGTKEVIKNLCEEAKQYKFKAVCVNPMWVKYASELLINTDVEVATVIGFPLGATTTAAKVAETKQAIADGATEIDVVLSIGKLLDGEFEYVKQDLTEVVKASASYPVKVIIEAVLLNKDQKIMACELSKEAGAAYVKTSTGFSTGGATIEDVALMRKVVGARLGVKASGGVRNAEQAKQMIKAGATRIGTSSGIKMVTE
jgi:deoxyribose-phosphate aldolase